MSKVLVTGAYGFVGRHVAKQFSQIGWVVVGIGHGSWARDEWRQWGIDKWHPGDVTFDALKTLAVQPDAIIHCAGSGSVGFSVTNPYQDFQRTVESTVAVLEFARLHANKACVVYPSSAAVYGDVEQLPITEKNKLLPISPYGTHKLIAEELCQSYARNYKVKSAIVRLFSVYGAGLKKQLMWDASSRIIKGGNQFFGTGKEVRDWLHVKDAANLLLAAAANASEECPVVNGGSGVGVSVGDLLHQLFALYKQDGAPLFNSISKTGDPLGLVASIDRAEHWGWRPEVPLSEGLNEYVEWFLRQGKVL